MARGCRAITLRGSELAEVIVGYGETHLPFRIGEIGIGKMLNGKRLINHPLFYPSN
jgi:hypothetical protein